MYNPTKIKRTLFFVILDVILSLLTLYFAYNLRFNFDIPNEFIENFVIVFLTLLPLKILSIKYFKIYLVAWRFFSLVEAKKLFYAHLVAYSAFILIYYLNQDMFSPFPRSVLIIDLFLSIMFIGSLRILKRILIESGSNKNLKKTLLIGTSSLAQIVIKEKNDFYVAAVVDDIESSIGSYLSNIPVQSFTEIEDIIKSIGIESVVIAKDFHQEHLKSIFSRLKENGILDIKIVSLNDNQARIKNITVEDLLARYPQDLDKKKIHGFIKNKAVLITGAGGSIGSEICRQCEIFGAKKLILLDHSEYNLYSIGEEIKNIEVSLVMQSVINIDSLEITFKEHRPDIVIHAAAYKHVPLVESNILVGIKNNIIGTKNVIDLSIKYGVKKFIMISTDKAVRPTNVMGATKRISELYAQNSNGYGTDIVAVRFGNVLGSSGSVIPKFRSQIENGENVTVTHPDITRYFMLIPEACELVLQAGAIGTGGEIFILDMGEPVKIVDLAKKMIELSGRDDINIEYIGLRPGEKLYEELLIDESDAKTEYESITVAAPTKYDIDKLNNDIEELLSCENKLEKLKEIVPEFNHQTNM